ncbi:MAG: hypothetical protein ACFFED_03170 [Candidatus Thorarchaeota archaeon]
MNGIKIENLTIRSIGLSRDKVELLQANLRSKLLEELSKLTLHELDNSSNVVDELDFGSIKISSDTSVSDLSRLISTRISDWLFVKIRSENKEAKEE